MANATHRRSRTTTPIGRDVDLDQEDVRLKDGTG